MAGIGKRVVALLASSGVALSLFAAPASAWAARIGADAFIQTGSQTTDDTVNNDDAGNIDDSANGGSTNTDSNGADGGSGGTGSAVLEYTVVDIDGSGSTAGSSGTATSQSSSRLGQSLSVSGSLAMANAANGGISTASLEMASGWWGDCAWTLDMDGVLTIGSGFGADIESYEEVPWYDHRYEIVKVVFSGDVVFPAQSLFLFYECENLVEVEGAPDTMNVMSMRGMFSCCRNLVSLDLSGWNVERVNEFGEMFDRCTALVTLDVSGWNPSSAFTMLGMFSGCESLESIEGIRDWQLTNMEYVAYMFANCSSLKSLNLSNWNTSNIIDMSNMFRDCSSLESLDLSGWNTTSVTSANDMFAGTGNLKEISIGDEWFNSSVMKDNSGTYPFDNSTTATWTKEGSSLAAVTWSTLTEKYGTEGYTAGTYVVSEIEVNYWGTCPWWITDDGVLHIGAGTGENMQSFYQKGPWCSESEQIKKVVFEEGVIFPEISRNLFKGCANLVEVEGVPDTSNVTIMSGMFMDCSSLTTPHVEDWNVEKVQQFCDMFWGCTSLESLDLSSWNTISAIYTTAMFFECTSLSTLKGLDGWQTEKLEDAGSMFFRCSSLKSLDLSGWNTSNLETVMEMFADCSSLESLDVSNWDTSQVRSGEHMFAFTDNLKKITIGDGWFKSRVMTEEWMGTYPFNESTTATWTKVGSFAAPVTWGTLAEKFGMEGYTDGTYVVVDVNYWGTCPWWITDDGTLYIGAGTGADVSGGGGAPWYDERTSITKVVFEEGVIFPSSSWYLFQDCANLVEIEGVPDTSNATTMTRMFSGCASLTTPNAEGWNVEKVTNFEGMFANCSSLESLDLSHWDTISAINTISMFYKCTSLSTLKGLTGWQTEKLKFADRMFACCSSLKSLDLSGWDTSSLEMVMEMFAECSELQELDVSGWDTSDVGDTRYMFVETSNLKKITIGNGWFKSWSMTEEGEGAYPFNMSTTALWAKEGSALTPVTWGTLAEKFGTDGYTAGTYVVVDVNYWGTCPWWITDDGTLYIGSGTGTDIVGDDGSPWYDERDRITKVVFSDDVIFPSNVQRLFVECSNLTAIEGVPDTSGVTKMSEMFKNCSALSMLNLSDWIVGGVEDFSMMFEGCSSLESLDVSGWDTGSAIGMDGMFKNCSSLTALDLSNWQTGSVWTMDYMFQGCSALESLNVFGWDTTNVGQIHLMFDGTSSLKTITIGDGWFGSRRMKNDVTAYPFNMSTTVPWAKEGSSLAPVTWGTLAEKYGDGDYTAGTYVIDVNYWGTCPWWITDDGVLHIGAGTGEDIPTYNKGPWCSESELITKVVFEEGVIFPEVSQNLFNGCANLVEVEGIPDTSNVTNMMGMFTDCSSLTTPNVEDWNVEKVTSFGNMFTNCSSLESLDLSGWNTISATVMTGMFFGCTSLSTLTGLDSWQTENLKDASWMFYRCSSLTSLDLSGWNTSTLRSVEYMFDYCLELQSLNVFGWDTSNMRSVFRMLEGTVNLKRITIGDGWFKSPGMAKEWMVTFPFNGSTTALWIKEDDSSMVPVTWGTLATKYGTEGYTAGTYVVYEPGVELPSVGGDGIQWGLTAIGALLTLLGAAIALSLRRRDA